MLHPFVEALVSEDARVRDRPLEELVAGLDVSALLAACDALDVFWRQTENLYERVRALLVLAAIHRVHLPARPELPARGPLSKEGHAHLLARRFEQALDAFLDDQRAHGPSAATSSALAAACRALAFDTLARQVRASVRRVAGNRWMFFVARADEHPLRVREELLAGAPDVRRALRESTPVRMDLSHSGWSDIFFLGMDRPEGARVLNVSVDLAVRGRDELPMPPVETTLRVVDRPVLVLESVDLDERVELSRVRDAFDFAADHLGLLRAGVVASGLVPPGMEHDDAPLAPLLARLCGEGRGLQLTTCVRGIPKGSRLAVSTTLLASIVSLLMRATGQTRALEGPLDDDERRLVVARALLGEWLGGSGGGWQDSGGLWPGLKLIAGARAEPGDPEHGVSRGRLLPSHRVLAPPDVHPAFLARLQACLVLAHGGMAQDVGPILEMVTERYLLRSADAWAARRRAEELFDEILLALRGGDVRRLARCTDETFFGPVRTIVPWTSNAYTERVVAALRARHGDGFWGFMMLGGMAGGGMGFLFDPDVRDAARASVHDELLAARRALSDALPFAMDPVLYDVAVDSVGTRAGLVASGAISSAPPPASAAAAPAGSGLPALLATSGFDRARHEHVRAELLAGRIGLARNRLPAGTRIEDVRPGDVVPAGASSSEDVAAGERALAAGELAVVTLAGGAGTRWTHGAGTVKALSPFVRLGGTHRSFLELHLRATALAGERAGRPIPHVVTTSLHTHDALARFLAGRCEGDRVRLSRGRVLGLRLVPTVRDLRFQEHETARQVLDVQAQKVADSLHEALCEWARESGEGSDYADNAPMQCVHPVGHFYEVPNLLLSGTLATLLRERPSLTTLLVHNVDTVGVTPDAALFGAHLRSGAALSFEVVPRRLDDEGGGLARVDGRLRLVEGLALPRDDDALALSYYNTLTTWVDVDGLLALFGLARDALDDRAALLDAVRRVEDRLPTYVTLKHVTRRWGHGQQDVLPTLQWEKLWGDVSALPGVRVRYAAVERVRGQQLKEPSQLDGWWLDGSAAAVGAGLGWTPG